MAVVAWAVGRVRTESHRLLIEVKQEYVTCGKSYVRGGLTSDPT